jgi:hypothetical protein
MLPKYKFYYCNNCSHTYMHFTNLCYKMILTFMGCVSWLKHAPAAACHSTALLPPVCYTVLMLQVSPFQFMSCHWLLLYRKLPLPPNNDMGVTVSVSKYYYIRVCMCQEYTVPIFSGFLPWEQNWKRCHCWISRCHAVILLKVVRLWNEKNLFSSSVL